MSRSTKGGKVSELIGVILVIGGVLGAAATLWTSAQVLHDQGSKPVLPMLILLAICVWSILTGAGLWAGIPAARKSAIALFAAQIPIIEVPGFIYHFYSILDCPAIMARAGETGFGFHFVMGADFQIGLLSDTQNFILGLNLVPIFVLFCLWMAWRKPQSAVQVPTTS